MGKKIYILGVTPFSVQMVLDLKTHLEFADITELVIADSNLEEATEVLGKAKDERIHGEYVDVSDVTGTAKNVRSFDLFVNCTPSEALDDAIRIACQAEVDYADLGNSLTSEMIEMIKKTGIQAVSVVGGGSQPVVVDLLAKKGAMSLDSTEEINLYWSSLRNIAPTKGMLRGILTENAPVCHDRQYYFNGRFISTGPFEGGKKVKLPEPVGEQMCYFMPYFGIRDMVKAVPGVMFVSSRGVWRPDIMQDIASLNHLGLLDEEEMDYKGQKINIFDFTCECIWKKVGRRLDRKYQWGYMYFIEVVGVKDGRRASIQYTIQHPDWYEQSNFKMVGITGSVNVMLLLKKGRGPCGYYPVLEYYDLNDLDYMIKELGSKGIVITEKIS